MRAPTTSAASCWHRSGLALAVAVLPLGCGASTRGGVDFATSAPPVVDVIVQGVDVTSVRAAVLEVGGTVTRELGIIRAVVAEVTPSQREALAEHAAVKRVFEDRAVLAQDREVVRWEAQAEDE